MALYLVQKLLNGKPVGIFAEDGTSFHSDTDEGTERIGKSVVADKGTQVPWEEFVDQKVASVNHRSWWADLTDTETDLEALLEKEISRWRASQ